MDDDLNISVALAALFDFVRDVNSILDNNAVSKQEAQKIQELMAGFDRVLGVLGNRREEKLSDEAMELINRREEARKAKDWKTADQIREQLMKMGITIQDTPQGVKWRTAKG